MDRVKASPQQFDPAKVAYYEKAGWEAYYARQWGRAFGLMVSLNREQFRMPLLTAIAGAVDIVRASQAFVPLENNDVPLAQKHMERYYNKARRSVGLEAEAAKLAELEMDYWVVHRQLAQQRKADKNAGNPASMVESLRRLHAALFKAEPGAVKRSAELRAEAAVAVDRITGGYSKDVAAD
ncbi:MAG: hypothetical protein WEC37_02380 [Anaerolineales bacterium]